MIVQSKITLDRMGRVPKEYLEELRRERQEEAEAAKNSTDINAT